MKTLRDYAVFTIASFIFAMSWEGFMIPAQMSAGGMMGLCTVVEFATGGMIQAQYSYFALNVILILIAMLAMGIGFGFRTIYTIVVSSLAMELIHSVPALHCVPGEFFFVEERTLIPIIAGVLEAVGIGLVLRNGGSTGGTDIVALMVNKYWPVSLSKTFAVLDFAVVALLLLLPDKSFSDMVYGIEEIVTFTLMIDMVVGGARSSYQLFVFSEKYQDIADHIINNLDRGATVLNAQGWFTKQNRNVLLILISRKQFPALSRTIKQIDPKAFMSVSPTNSVYGEGFEQIKSGLPVREKKD